jgi:uncharacterized damage-inducible protein DinB
MENTFHKEFITQAIRHFEENPPRIKNCLNRLSEAEVWQKPNSQSNSIGNLILHLYGNITQYAVASLGGQPDKRQRDLEFSTRGGISKEELLKLIQDAAHQAVETMRNCSSEELLRKRMVQGFEYSGIGIIIHVTEHFSYHTGQIAFWTKYIKEEDLGFYANLDLNTKNE